MKAIKTIHKITLTLLLSFLAVAATTMLTGAISQMAGTNLPLNDVTISIIGAAFIYTFSIIYTDLNDN